MDAFVLRNIERTNIRVPLYIYMDIRRENEISQ